MIYLNENRLVDVECTKAIFYFFKVIHYCKKKLPLKLARKYKYKIWANELKYKVDFDKSTEKLISFAYE